LLVAEALANPGWLVGEPSPASVHERIVAACRESGLAVPAILSVERTEQVLRVLSHLASEWRGIRTKGAIDLDFDAREPFGAFERLRERELLRG
jgi:hypothetical protein